LKARILIFEDNDFLRSTLKNLLEELGYEVHTFSNPGMCSQFYSSKHSCLLDDSCSDIIISDVNMPVETGLEFIKSRFDNGCKIKFRALMSAGWNETDLQQAEMIGCKVFHKPFDLEELIKWLDNCRKQIETLR
jgi:CheY-like chemotaxis protein